MPIYQYECLDCGHQLEVLQKMSDPRLKECPSCQQPTLEKQLTAAAFKLNGSGWYETDFKNSGAKPETAKGDSDTKSKSAPTKKAKKNSPSKSSASSTKSKAAAS